ncbi:unnamed protein product, partial [Meganyctiphanes norvegica]
MNCEGFIENDEFECSECDFKCSSEIEMIQHSSMHQPINNNININVPLNTYPGGSIIEYESKGNDNLLNLQTKFKSEKETESSTKLTETPELNDFHTYKSTLKRELSFYEEINTSETNQECELVNKKIKMESIHIDQETVPDFSSHPINEHDIIHNAQNSLGSMQSNTKYIAVKEGIMHSPNNNMNIFTEDGILRSEVNADVSGSLSCRSAPTQINYTEVEVDNTGVYIPPGWKRKLFMKSITYQDQIKYCCYYFTELGKRIRCKADAQEYLNKNPSADVDTQKLNFLMPKKLRKPVKPQQRVEMGVNNTEIYVPKGWQRIIRVNEKSTNKRCKYKVNYISPEGKIFWCRSNVFSYVSMSNRPKDKQVEIERMDFTVKNNSNYPK